MPKLRVLSGSDILKFLQSMGFVIDRQKGSHIVLARKIGASWQMLTIPNHHEIDKGTTKGIYNQSKKFISQEDLDRFFYTN